MLPFTLLMLLFILRNPAAAQVFVDAEKKNLKQECNAIQHNIFILYYSVYTHTHIYIYMLTPPPPPMIHTKLLFLISGSWEVGSLGCENIGRDQISPQNS